MSVTLRCVPFCPAFLTRQSSNCVPSGAADEQGTLANVLAIRERLALNEAPYVVESIIVNANGDVPFSRTTNLASLRIGPSARLCLC